MSREDDFLENDNFELDVEDLDIEIPELDFLDVEKIVDSGLKKKLSFRESFINIFREIGLKNIFHDKVELLGILGIGTLSLVCLLIFILDSQNGGYIFSSIFLISPIFYFVTSILSFLNASYKGTKEIEMTCKYNLNQLSAVRTFVLSILAALLNTIAIFIVGLFNNEISIFNIIATSITAIFLFSAILLFVMARVKHRYIKHIIVVVWIFTNILLSISSTWYEQFLSAMPVAIHIVITLGCLFVYIKSLSRYMNLRGEE